MSAAAYVTDTEIPFATAPVYGSSHSQEERYVKASSPLYDRMRKSHYNSRKECNAFLTISAGESESHGAQHGELADMPSSQHALPDMRSARHDPTLFNSNFPFGNCHRPAYFPKRSRSAYLILAIITTASLRMTLALSVYGPSLKQLHAPLTNPSTVRTMQRFHTFFSPVSSTSKQ
jgi:hypothetical protein